MAFVLFSAMRNEGPFLLDWVSYHRAIGFDKIVIVTNDCDDGSVELLQKLASYDFITHLDQTVPSGQSPQSAAVEQARQMDFMKDGDWGIFLDADEYLNIHVGDGSVTDLVNVIEQAGAVGMLVAWRLFGDSGHLFFPGSYVRDDYTKCENRPALTQFKTFFRKGAVAAGFSAQLHRCRLHPNNGKLADFLTGSAKPIDAIRGTRSGRRHRRWLLQGEESYSHISGSEIDYTVAQINHYIVRDPKSYAMKQKRGRGHTASGSGKSRHTSHFYRINNHNSAHDDSIVKWKAEVERQKAELVAHCKITPELAKISAHYLRSDMISDPKTQPASVDIDFFPLTFPENVAAFVRHTYSQAEAILEYGSGGSTNMAAELGVNCVAVESDENWAARLTAHLNAKNDTSVSARVIHIDIGPTKSWGYPRNSARWQHFWRYPMQIWQENLHAAPDVVLIDGRMRKACFAATLLHITRETTILFDDYTDRPAYHAVEEIIAPRRFVGRMAEFVVTPGMLDHHHFQKLIPWFFDLQ